MRPFTVWEFRGCIVPQPPVLSALASEMNDYRVQHEFQKVVWSGMAWSKEDALRLAAIAIGR
jgi:hypothetical protein